MSNPFLYGACNDRINDHGDASHIEVPDTVVVAGAELRELIKLTTFHGRLGTETALLKTVTAMLFVVLLLTGVLAGPRAALATLPAGVALVMVGICLVAYMAADSTYREVLKDRYLRVFQVSLARGKPEGYVYADAVGTYLVEFPEPPGDFDPVCFFALGHDTACSWCQCELPKGMSAILLPGQRAPLCDPICLPCGVRELVIRGRGYVVRQSACTPLTETAL